MVENEAIVATSHPIPAYGGVQLGENVLHQMAEALRQGDLPFILNHDIRTPLTSTVLDAAVRDRTDGYKEVWVRYEADSVQWAKFQLELVNAGAPGGMSFACGELIGSLSARESASEGARFILAADASHWDDAALSAAGDRLRDAGGVELQRRYEFAHIPNAVVVLQVAGTVGLGVIANAVYDALKRFLKPRTPTVFHFHVAVDGIDVNARLETEDPESLRRALDSFDRLVRPGQLYVWDDDEGRWIQP